MAAPRFFVRLDLAPAHVGTTMPLPEAAAHHAVRVVRLGLGDALTLFDGNGGEYEATIAAVDKRGASVRIDAHHAVERESPLAVTLVQAIAANDAMDYAMRKATEMGVTRIQPVVSERSAPMPAGERGDKRHAHWQQVAIAACEQCGRNRVPMIEPVRAFGDWLAAWRDGGVVFAPDAEGTIGALPAAPRALLVGPEGGFTAREIAAARAHGIDAVRIGPRVLRTETAGVAALAAMQTLWGDWK
jgi:16S rRNA (uracil1498-N3)-methyltransferase